MKIYGKTIWITDAAEPLGHALALELMRSGNFVIASAAHEYSLERLVFYSGGAISALPLSFSGNTSVQRAGSQLQKLTDHLDIVVANATAQVVNERDSIDLELSVRRMNADFFGTVRTLDIALPLLQQSRLPYVVCVGNGTYPPGLPGVDGGEASRAAMEYFARALAADLYERNIDMSIVRLTEVDRKATECNPDRLTSAAVAATQDRVRRLRVGMERRKPIIQLAKRPLWWSTLVARLPTFREREPGVNWHRRGGRIG